MSTHYSDESSDEPLRQLQIRLQTERATQHAASHTPPHTRQPLLSQVPGRHFDEKDYHRYHDFDDDGDDTHYGEENEPKCCDTKHEGSCVNRVGAHVRSRRGAKLFAVLIGIGLLIFACMHWIVYPTLLDLEMQGGFMKYGEERQDTIGAARGGDFKHGANKIQDLDERYIPGGENDPHGQRRLVFVGDTHGCKEELLKLLKKVNFDPSLDHLIATGDTISKGPHSAGVLDHLIHLNATTVLGNHEDHLIHTAKSTFGAFTSTTTESSMQALQDTDALIDLSSASRRDARTLKSLRARHLRYIQHMPLILRIRPLPQALKPNTKPNSPIAEEILVVHAGLVPALPLEKQDPYYVTNMRSLHAKSHVPSADRAGKKKKVRHNKPWRNIWNWYNDRLYRHKSTKGFRESDTSAQDVVPAAERRNLVSESTGFLGQFLTSAEDTVREYVGRPKHHDEQHDKPQVVVYGHDAKSGLRIKRWSKGMDSGCVGGGRLSALVLNAKGQGEVVHVGCRQYW
jgi:hypothetical protein